MQFQDTLRILKSHHETLSNGVASLIEEIIQKQADLDDARAEQDKVEKAISVFETVDVALIDRLVAGAERTVIGVDLSSRKDISAAVVTSRNGEIVGYNPMTIIVDEVGAEQPAPQVEVVLQEAPEAPAHEETPVAEPEVKAEPAPDPEKAELDAEAVALAEQMTFFESCRDLCDGVSKLDANTLSNRLAMKIGGTRFVEMDPKHRPDFLRQFPDEVKALKAMESRLPEVHPELPEMTQDDQDVILAMRDAGGATKICELDEREIAIRAKVNLGILNGDILPRLIRLGKIARINPDVYPPRHRIADADATFPAPLGAKPLPQTAMAILSASARTVKGKVYAHILRVSNGKTDPTVSLNAMKTAIELKIRTAQVNDAVNQLVEEGALQREKAHAQGWIKVKLLVPATA